MSSSKSAFKGRTVGIDFGTSTISVAYSVDRGDGTAEITTVNLSGKSPLMPSRVEKSGDKFVFGEFASNYLPDGSIKAQLTSWDRGTSEKFVFSVGGAEEDGLRFLTELLEEVVKRARENSKISDLAGKDDVVYLCCPASWGRRARRILFESAKGAGLNVKSYRQLIDEPVAAGWHVLSDPQSKNERVLVFDAGGGTVDVALLSATSRNGAERRVITVVNADAIPESGDKSDEVFAQKMSAALGREILPQEAEQAKKNLSVEMKTTVPFSATRENFEDAYLSIFESHVRMLGKSYQKALLTEMDLAEVATGGRPTNMSGSVARSYRFNDLEVAEKSMTDAPRAFEKIRLTGGMAHIPFVAKSLRQIFPNVDVAVVDDPQLAVCRGLTQMKPTTWMNGSRLPIALRARWSVKGLSDDQVASQYPELKTWMEVQQKIDLLEPHCDPWRGAVGQEMSFGQIKEIETPPAERFPNEQNWEFILEIQAKDESGNPVSVSLPNGGSIQVSHRSRRPATIKLLASRQIVVAGSKGERFMGEVAWSVGGDLRVEMGQLIDPSAPLPWPYLEGAASNIKDPLPHRK